MHLLPDLQLDVVVLMMDCDSFQRVLTSIDVVSYLNKVSNIILKFLCYVFKAVLNKRLNMIRNAKNHILWTIWTKDPMHYSTQNTSRRATARVKQVIFVRQIEAYTFIRENKYNMVAFTVKK